MLKNDESSDEPGEVLVQCTQGRVVEEGRVILASNQHGSQSQNRAKVNEDKVDHVDGEGCDQTTDFEEGDNDGKVEERSKELGKGADCAKDVFQRRRHALRSVRIEGEDGVIFCGSVCCRDVKTSVDIHDTKHCTQKETGFFALEISSSSSHRRKERECDAILFCSRFEKIHKELSATGHLYMEKYSGTHRLCTVYGNCGNQR